MTMFAVFVDEPNFDEPLSSLIVGERPDPFVPDGWVRVKITGASLNWHDLWTLRGMGAARGRPELFPMILGCDGVGTLDDDTGVIIYPVMGDPDWRGDETLDPSRNVLSEVHQGTFADYVVVPRRNAVPLPKGMSLATASVMGASWLTAYRMLFSKSGLRPGQTMLVQGASGGVATALIQLRRVAGMRVWAAGRSEEKRSLAESIGAHRTFVSQERLPELVDAVFDTAGAATWHHSMHSVRPGGTVVLCGVTTGDQPGAELTRLFIEQITVTGVYAGTLQELRDLVAFVTTNSIEPLIGQVLPMESAEKGFRAMWEGRTTGKIVFTR